MDAGDMAAAAPATPIYRLPVELLSLIINFCSDYREVSALSRASRRLNDIAGRLLYEKQVYLKNYDPVYHAASSGCIGTIKRWLTISSPSGSPLGPLDVYAVNTYIDKAPGTQMISYVRGPLSLKDRRTYFIFSSPLHRAAQSGHLDVIELLLEHGCDVNAPSLLFTKMGLSCFRDARDRGNPQAENCVVLTPLHVSIIYGQPAAAKLLLERGADVRIWLRHSDQASGVTALHLAAVHGRSQTVTELVQGGYSKVDELDGDGTPPMLYAAEHEANLECMDVLHRLGADLDMQLGSDVKQPLLAALIEKIRFKAASRLIDLGASVDAAGGQSAILALCERAKISAIYPDAVDLAVWNDLVARVKSASQEPRKFPGRFRKLLSLGRTEK
ncbi:uncharacterized protein E0L32_009413 [Thyridium curvatum]|uniref:Uncharacterized protein n=1 Tax=Thyridium curvatum TaxID=1093900 RepID=A0A507AWJ7_9PEZI|nr:uncharacterized protein E0L32_009413 [Thyridium curvatum]TPX09369.1 hypothetical protein E0L32_009413 [Thyridium curvatum]